MSSWKKSLSDWKIWVNWTTPTLYTPVRPPFPLPVLTAHSRTVFPADNGFAIGSHRRQPGKTLGFEQDLHVPLIVRGPDILPGSRDSISSWGMVDLAKTIMGIAGARADYIDDGREIALPRKASSDDVGLQAMDTHKADHAISEFWVLGVEEGKYAGEST